MRKAFTLIELLIVVAIIAILAAIAVPNFLEAQTRAKVSRAVADMRGLATALESYTVDNNKVTERCPGGAAITGRSVIYASNPSPSCVSCRFKRLTTPIAYYGSVPAEVFVLAGGYSINLQTQLPDAQYDTFDFFTDSFDPAVRAASLTSGATWRIASAGPDKIQAYGGAQQGNLANVYGVDYDPTNGTLSRGDLVRISGAQGRLPGPLPGIDRARNKINP